MIRLHDQDRAGSGCGCFVVVLVLLLACGLLCFGAGAVVGWVAGVAS